MKRAAKAWPSFRARTPSRRSPSYPYLLQELIDTAGGIPDVTPGRHDLRVVMIESEVIYCYVRIPAEASYISNYNLNNPGSTWHGVPLLDLPTGMRRLCATVDDGLQDFPGRVYSIDAGLDRDGKWKLFELNSKPAISQRDTHEGSTEFMERLADILVQKARR